MKAEFDKNIQGQRPSNQQSKMLLLDDDGRMLRLLERLVEPEQAVRETSILEGIAYLGSNPVNLVLLNIERLGRRTASVVKAMRRVEPRTRVVIYGEGYTESFARVALENGANEFLVWPIPLTELRSQLNGVMSAAVPTGSGSKSEIRTASQPASRDEPQQQHSPKKIITSPSALTQKILERYEYLSQLIPRGESALIQEAEKNLTELLQVEWVRIISKNQPDAVKEEQEAEKSASKVLPLVSFSGHFGKIFIGPPLMDQPAFDPYQITGFIATILQLAQRDEALRHLAMTDELTGAHNRRYLELFVTKIIEQYHQHKTELTLLLFDIDEFKHYNDHYGHSAGDDILRQATRLIRRCCREHDIVARIGGDEFAVLFWDSDRPRQPYPRQEDEQIRHPQAQPAHHRPHSEMAMMLINRFRRLMMSNEFPNLGPEVRHGVLTISGGLACYPCDGETVQELLAAADEALLNAKRSGKNRVYLVGQPRES